MNRIRMALLCALVLALGACDGGSRGSGITTAQGNSPRNIQLGARVSF